MSSRIYKKRMQKKKIRNAVIILVIAMCLFIIYKFNFLTKSEVEVTAPINFKEYGCETELKADIPLLQDEEGEYYIILPEKVNGIFASNYVIDDSKDNEIKDKNPENNTISENKNSIENSNSIVSNDLENNTVTDNKSKVTNDVVNNTVVNNKVENTSVNTVVDDDKTNIIKNESNNNETKENEFKTTEIAESLFDAAINKKTETLASGETSHKETEQKTVTDENKDIIDDSEPNNEKEEVREDKENNENKDSENDKENNDDKLNTTSNLNSSNTVTNTVKESDNKVTNTVANAVVDNTENIVTNTNTVKDSNNNSKENIDNKENKENTVNQDNKVLENNQDVVKQDDNKENSNDPFIYEKVIEEGKELLKPGNKYYLSKEDAENGKITIEVEFQTTEFNNRKLYNQELIYDMPESQIKLVCFVPLGFYLDVKLEDTKKIQELKADVEEISNSETLLAYDIKIKDENEEFQPEDYNQVAKVSISTVEKIIPGDGSSNLQVLHIDDKNEDSIKFEKILLSEKTDNSVEFVTDEFSVYAIVLYASVQPDSVTVNTVDKDKEYYYGKNYTDDIKGEFANKYNDDNLIIVHANYYSYKDDLNVETPSQITGSAVNRNAEDGYYEVTFTATGATNLDIDPNQGWEIKCNVGDNFNLNSVRTNAGNTNKFDDITYEDGLVTITGSNWNAWECVDYKNYKLALNFYYTDNTYVVNNLVITGGNKRHLVGYVGPKMDSNGVDINLGPDDKGERQTLFNYSFVVPKDNLDNITFDTIDNPFMDRPAGYGFNGWVEKRSDASPLPAAVIETNRNTKVQSAKVNVGANKEITIDFYADWTEANEVFINTERSKRFPRVPTSLSTNSFNTATNNLRSRSKTSDKVSNRELNIVYLINGVGRLENNFGNTACTITSLYNGIDFRSDSAMYRVNDNYILSADLQLDYLNTNGTKYSDNSEKTGDISNYIIGNCKNIRIGRGMYPLNDNEDRATVTQIQCGRYNNTNYNPVYRAVIESGKYTNIQCGRAEDGGSYRANAIVVLGNDFDRENGDNTSLKVYDRFSSRTSSGNVSTSDSSLPLYFMNVKSGTIGIDYFNSHKNDDRSNYFYTGIYIGGHGYTDDDNGNRVLKVDGGEIANIIGGLSTSNETTSLTNCYVTGGHILNIVGGAGRSVTYGDRIIQITGGNIEYSVFGGSNGIKSGNNEGYVYGNSLVYIGGDCTIGSLIDSNATLYGAENGCVFGAGNGNAQVENAGSVFSSHIIVDKNAKVLNSVYAGGNFGIIEPKSGSGKVDVERPHRDLLKFIDKSNNIENNNNYLITSSEPPENSICDNGSTHVNATLNTLSIPTDNQLWTIEKNSSNEYSLRNVATNRYLTITKNGNSYRLSLTDTQQTWFEYNATNHRLYTKFNQSWRSVTVYLVYNLRKLDN